MTVPGKAYGKKVDEGREFEKEMRTSFRKRPELYWLKLLDFRDFWGYGPRPMKQTQNPADYFVMRDTELYLIECKVFAQMKAKNLSFAFSRVTENQVRGLVRAACYPHVHSIVICKVFTEAGFRVWAMTIWQYVDLVLAKGAEGRMSARWLPDVMLYSTELFRDRSGWRIDPLWGMKCPERKMTQQQMKALMWSLGRGRLVRQEMRKAKKKPQNRL